MRLFVNREQMLEKIIKVSNQSEKELTFEIGSNSDLILEKTMITSFSRNNKKVYESIKDILQYLRQNEKPFLKI